MECGQKFEDVIEPNQAVLEGESAQAASEIKSNQVTLDKEIMEFYQDTPKKEETHIPFKTFTQSKNLSVNNQTTKENNSKEIIIYNEKRHKWVPISLILIMALLLIGILSLSKNYYNNIDEIDNNGESKLTRAIIANNVSEVQTIIDKKANVNILYPNLKKPENKKTALFIAVENKVSCEIIDALIKAGADVNVVCPGLGTALNEAVGKGNGEVVKLLLQNGANPNTTGTYLPIINAVSFGHTDILKMLLDAGANPNVKDSLKSVLTKALDHAKNNQANGLQMIKLLVEAKVDINEKYDGYTPLMWAAINQQIDIYNYLIKAGADQTIKSPDGHTASYYLDYYNSVNVEKRYQENAARQEQERKAKAKSEGVRIGMTKQQVLDSSWGKPQRVNTTKSAYGVHEQWVYGGHNYLYFEDGILTTIQN